MASQFFIASKLLHGPLPSIRVENDAKLHGRPVLPKKLSLVITHIPANYFMVYQQTLLFTLAKLHACPEANAFRGEPILYSEQITSWSVYPLIQNFAFNKNFLTILYV
jgi:hypothetical protein